MPTFFSSVLQYVPIPRLKHHHIYHLIQNLIEQKSLLHAYLNVYNVEDLI